MPQNTFSNSAIKTIAEKYHFNSPSIILGALTDKGIVYPDAEVAIPLKSLTRHGLIAGATGAGKTKTLQMLTEQLSFAGIPVLVMDLKGDLSGLAVPGEVNPKLAERIEQLKMSYTPASVPAELLTLMSDQGVRLRATISEFGPIVLAKMLGLNPTQGSVLAVIFQYCKNNNWPLVDLADLQQVLAYVQDQGKDEITKTYGYLSPASIGAILRRTVELEGQGGTQFFSEPSFDVNDLTAVDENQYGRVSIFRVLDIQDKPMLFSSFMLGLLNEIYNHFPELGDVQKPKLVIFIDEAHLLFAESSPELLKQMDMIIKLIRSKGVGVFFCTQNPTDIPEAVLSQLGTKCQHALRAVTAKDRKQIRLVAENFPESTDFNIENLLTSLGVGEALVTSLDEDMRPTPVVPTLMRPPVSRMGILTDSEINNLVAQSTLAAKYAKTIDRDSAREILQRKISELSSREDMPEKGRRRSKKEVGAIEALSKNTLVRQLVRNFFNQMVRALLSIFKSKN